MANKVQYSTIQYHMVGKIDGNC